MLTPVRTTPPPAYPGAAPQRRFFHTLALFLHGKVTLPVCVFLVLSAAQVFAESPRPAGPAGGDGGNLVVAQVQEPACRGKIALDPPPCKGDVAMPEPPPCSGEIALPDPPPCAGVPRPDPFPPQPEPAPEISLRALIARPRDFVDRRVLVRGILGRAGDGSLFENGYYLYIDRPRTAAGEFFGCPLVGGFPAPAEGTPVTVTGRVVRRHEGPGGRRRPGTYYVLQIESVSRQ